MGAQAAKLRPQVEEYEWRLAEDPNCLTPKELTDHETVKSAYRYHVYQSI
jgi:hypothetical protein